jgi:hypothetical protein
MAIEEVFGDDRRCRRYSGILRSSSVPTEVIPKYFGGEWDERDDGADAVKGLI